MKRLHTVVFKLYYILEKVKTTDTVKKKKISDCQGFIGKKGGMNRWYTGVFEHSETILCDTVMMDTFHHYTCKVHKIYNTK